MAKRQAASHSETRDGILWNVDHTERYARVKIQGSGNTFVVARFPENWEKTPNWLKPGNSVRIIHRGGNRHKIELTGHGQTVPTFYDGSATAPPKTVGANAVVEGLKVFATNPASMRLNITAGIWRFEGVDYSNVVGDYTMHEESEVTMSETSEFTMMESSYVDTVTIETAPDTGYWRYDAIVIRIDGIIDVIKGTPFNVLDGQQVDDLSFLHPATPDYHIRIALVLVPGGATSIVQANVNSTWYLPIPSLFEITEFSLRHPVYPADIKYDYVYADDMHAFEYPDGPYQSLLVTLTIKDQYGYPYIPLVDEVVVVTINNATQNGTVNDYGQFSDVDEEYTAQSMSLPLQEDGTVQFRWSAIEPIELELDRRSPIFHYEVAGNPDVMGELVLWWAESQLEPVPYPF